MQPLAIKLIILIVVYLAIISFLVRYSRLPSIKLQKSRYIPQYDRRCRRHTAGIKKGQLILLDDFNCSVCDEDPKNSA